MSDRAFRNEPGFDGIVSSCCGYCVDIVAVSREAIQRDCAYDARGIEMPSDTFSGESELRNCLVMLDQGDCVEMPAVAIGEAAAL